MQQLRVLSPHIHSPPGLLSLEQEDFGLQGGRSSQSAKMGSLWTFPSKAPQLLRSPSWSGAGTGRVGAGEGDPEAQSPGRAGLAGRLCEASEAWMLCIRDPPPQRDKAQGHLRTKEWEGGRSAMALSREPLLAVDLARGMM